MFYSPTTQSFSEPVQLDHELHKCVSVSFSLLRWDRMSLPSGWFGSEETQIFRLWVTSSSWGQTLLGKTALMYSRIVTSPLPQLDVWEDFFLVFTVMIRSSSKRWNSQKCEYPVIGCPLSFNFQGCPQWASSNLLIIVQVFLPHHWFLCRIRSWLSGSTSCDSLYLLVHLFYLGASVCLVSYLLWQV